MLKKTLAVFAAAAMLLPGSLVKAEPDPDPPCSFRLATRDGRDRSSGYVRVYVSWQYRTVDSSLEVKPGLVTIYNYTGRSITLVTDRWQNSSGSVVQRGASGNISNSDSRTWYPTKWIRKSESPYVAVSAAATTRPGLGGSTKCRNY